MARRIALVEGIGVNLAGGSHHASADQREGFCGANSFPYHVIPRTVDIA
ncbi:MAG: hypothetical protein ACE5IQ_00090 [Candidatus Methylomirabilales bacterium]